MFHQGPEMVTKLKPVNHNKDMKILHHCKFLHFFFRGDAI